MLYRSIKLQLYPTDFRSAYGDEMARLFEDCCRAEYRSGAVLPLLRLGLFAPGDVARNAPLEHLSASFWKGGRAVALKRLFDVAAALVALALTAPLFAVTALLVKLDSSGPVLYGSRRVGRNGKLFDMYKFRRKG